MLVDARRVRRERESRTWSQEQLAQVAGLGLRTVQRIESSGVASLESARALASVFELPMEELSIAVSANLRPGLGSRNRVVSGLMTAISLTLVFFVARTAFAEQFQIDVGANINMGEEISQSVIAEAGESVELEFDDQLKAVITPGLVQVNQREMVSLSLQIFERDERGEYTLLESPDVVHREGGSWQLRLSETSSGNSYRLVVTPHRESS